MTADWYTGRFRIGVTAACLWGVALAAGPAPAQEAADGEVPTTTEATTTEEPTPAEPAPDGNADADLGQDPAGEPGAEPAMPDEGDAPRPLAPDGEEPAPDGEEPAAADPAADPAPPADATPEPDGPTTPGDDEPDAPRPGDPPANEPKVIELDPAATQPQVGAAEDSAGPQGDEPTVRGSRVRTLDLRLGQTRFIDTPWPVLRVSINNPAVADVDVISPRRVQLDAKAPGATDLVLWSEGGLVWQARVEVGADLGPVEDQLKRMFPNASLTVSQLGEVVVVKGQLARAEDVPQLHRFLELSKVEFLDATTVAGVQQVQLQVKIAEVSRSAIRALGINTINGGNDFFGGVQIGSSSGPFVPLGVGVAEGASVAGNVPFTAVNDIVVPPSATLFAGFPNSDLLVFVQALAENQYLRVLAEPTLIAQSGEQANFLAGGEFPIPITELQGDSSQISIEYKEFGVRLGFRPTVLGNGRLNLQVLPEVSELSDVGAVEIQGTRIPSLLTRRVETTLEMKSGQTFAIAGLLNRTDNARATKVPGLGDLPVLGPLFRSVRYTQNETELLILVTASLVEPIDGDLPLPGMLHKEPNDWELYAQGRIAANPAARVAPAHVAKFKEMGLDKLRGPGGWVTYDRRANHLAGEGANGTAAE